MRHQISAAALVVLLAACSSEPAPTTPENPAPAPEAAAPAPAGEEALTPLFGTWGLDPAVCDQVIRISQTRFEGAENGCDIAGFADDGDGSYTASMTCLGEGQTSTERIRMRPVFAPTGEGVELTYIDRDNFETLLLRCPDPGGN